jgi:hypothetical protein
MHPRPSLVLASIGGTPVDRRWAFEIAFRPSVKSDRPPQSMSQPFRFVESDADHAKALAFNMLFMVWRHRTMNSAYRRGIQLARELYAQFPEGVGVCQVVEVDATPPDSETRTAFVEFLKLEAVKHFSVIHDGVGFKAASVRGVIASVHMLARPKCKHSVHSSVASAARWCEDAQRRLGRHETAEKIEDTVRSLRELHGSRYPREST